VKKKLKSANIWQSCEGTITWTFFFDSQCSINYIMNKLHLAVICVAQMPMSMQKLFTNAPVSLSPQHSLMLFVSACFTLCLITISVIYQVSVQSVHDELSFTLFAFVDVVKATDFNKYNWCLLLCAVYPLTSVGKVGLCVKRLSNLCMLCHT